MSTAPPPSQPDRPLQLVLIEDDAVFRLGLKLWLDSFADLEVVADVDGAAALEAIASRRNAATVPDLVILDLELGRTDPSQPQGLLLCQQIRSQFPTLPILLLSDRAEPVLLSAARQAGATGCCAKQLEAEALAAVIRQVAAGQPYWQTPSSLLRVPPNAPLDRPASAAAPPLAKLRSSLQQSGLDRIEAALADISAQLRNPDLSVLDRAVLAGRRRELRASRWLVRQLIAAPPERLAPAAPAPAPPPPSALVPIESATTPIATSIEQTQANAKTLQSVLFDRVLPKLQGGLQNQTSAPLEIDILRENKKRELLYLILRQFEELLEELRFSQVDPDQLFAKRPLILRDLWRSIVAEFYGRYATLTVGDRALPVVDVLLQDTETVQTAILNKIPLTAELIAHLLFQTPLLIDGAPHAAGSPEALLRGEVLLENLLIQTANAVVQPLLNRFPDVEAVKQSFYDFRLLSSREIERFRNSLSWKYRIEQSFAEPRAIFESQYRLLIFYGRGIQAISIYAARNAELADLSGVPLAVTIALEARDAIAPRLRAALSWVGSGVIYVLTEVLGRGIGLIGRGILKGMGGAWQDSRFSRSDSDRPR